MTAVLSTSEAGPARTPSRLVDRRPTVAPSRLVAELVPPRRFDHERFATFRPDPAQPSQQAAVERLEGFAATVVAPHGARHHRWSRRPPATTGPAGIYLDGGFGVGKTHLLASLWHAVPGPKVFGTFVELTNLVGALGFAATVAALAEHRLVAIDEFELDDPGDTVLMSSLLGQLVEHGVRLAATSNTLPGALGEGRFAADDFLREIQGLSDHFAILRVDGEDYRHRGLPEPPLPYDDATVAAVASATPGATLDDFATLLDHLAEVHPSRYGALLDQVSTVCLLGVGAVPDQNVALRLVVLADRLYDRAVPVVASGVAFDRMFTPEMLRGGYRKKYFRAISRLGALARDAATS